MSPQALASTDEAPPAGSSADRVACERIARAHARTFALASRFLPADKRRGAFALYAFCRGADDIVDDIGSAAGAAARERLAAYRVVLDDTLRGHPVGPVFRELHWAIARFDIPAEPLHELVAGVARDLEPVSYESWEELADYCAGVASSVGEMCARVFGVVGGTDAGERARGHARTLGVAMQLTNILRDVGEDARRGRCYLPAADLRAFGLGPEAVIGDPSIAQHAGWAPFMRMQIDRARDLYRDACAGIPLLAHDARRCAAACADGYAAILSAIERLDYDTVSSRARVDALGRLAVLWRAWRETPLVLPDARAASDDGVRWA